MKFMGEYALFVICRTKVRPTTATLNGGLFAGWVHVALHAGLFNIIPDIL